MVRSAKQNYTGTKRMESARKKSRSKGQSTLPKKVSARPKTSSVAGNGGHCGGSRASDSHFAVCVRNADYPASLELRKLYVVLEDTFAAEHQMMRIIDESGEDYLYPSSYFVRVELPSAVERRLRKI